MARAAAATLKGNPLTLIGPELKPGDKAPDFKVVDMTLSPVDLGKTGKSRSGFSAWCLHSIRRSADAKTKRFNDELTKMPGIDVFTVSMDLPFAQKRWCDAFAVDRVKMLSDHRDGTFGASYGTLVEDLRIECRAIFVVDQNNVIRHVEYVEVARPAGLRGSAEGGTKSGVVRRTHFPAGPAGQKAGWGVCPAWAESCWMKEPIGADDGNRS